MSNNRFSSCGSRTTGGGCDQDQPVFYPCTEGLQGGIERTRFFEGMVLESSDLENEQAYWRTKRELTNRALGEGVVWGLRTEWDSRSRSFTLGPGYAIDCCGRDLVVSECHTVSSRVLADPRNGVIAGLLADIGRGETARAHLVLRYVEQPEEARLACAASCQPGQQDRYEYTRMRETTQLCLVPEALGPARGPVGDFIDELEALRDGLSEEQLSALFPGSEELGTEVPPLYLIVRIGGEQRVIAPYLNIEDGFWYWGRKPVAVVASRPAATGTPGSQNEILVHLELRAGPGWALHHGSVALRQESKEILAEVTAPLALQLTWNLRIPLPNSGDSISPPIGAKEGANVSNLGLSRLFSPSERLLINELEVLLDCVTDPLRLDDGGNAVAEPDGTLLYQVTVTSGRMRAEIQQVVDDAAPGIEPDCFASLAPGGIFIGEQGKTPADPRPTILAALYAWLARSLQGLDLEDEEARPWSGERLLASWIYVVAWRLFYGANAVVVDFNDRESGPTDLARLLHCLLQRWCHGFLYPGPRCSTEHLGVVLGTVELAAGGRVAGFDAWDGRRHVLTGPLIGHWLGQLGVAPPDIVAGRFVRAICCVAQSDAYIPEAMPVSRLAEVFGQDVAWSELGPGAIAISGGAHLVMGNDDDITDRLTARGRSVLRRDEVTPWKFISCLVSAFGDASVPEPGAPLIQTVIAGQQRARLHLLIPASEAELRDARACAETLGLEIGRILARHRAEILSIGPLGEVALEDFITVLARDLALPAPEDDPASDLVKALREAGRPSLGDALALGPEGLRRELETLMGAEVNAPKVNQLWGVAINRLDLTARIVRAQIQEDYHQVTNPFTRRSLSDSDLIAHLSEKLILDSGAESEILVTSFDLRAAAKETIAMGP